jgi:hypothetical protein
VSILELCQWIQATRLSSALSGSTWGYPIVGAMHVLGVAWFGGVVLGSALHARAAHLLARWRSAGAAFMVLTGVLLFWSQPVRYYGSTSFRVKLLLLAILTLHATLLRGRYARASLLVWIAVIFAARGIAFF